jgi:hypothetical protein
LNWYIDEEQQNVSMVEEYDTTSAGRIVPPTWDKTDVSQWPWNEVWRSSRRVLGSARMLVVIGYSVPVTDQLSQALLRADVNKLGALVVVNPDPQARRRVIDVMSSAFAVNATVAELHTIEEFASYLPPSPTEPPSVDLSAELRRLRRDVRTAMERLERPQKGLAEQHEELESTIEEIQSTVDELDSIDESDIHHDVQRLSDEVRELDARIDSILR